ncbi:MAG: hypothetical protein GY719_30320 [bacterium]|nr:hypothetical protein [bacterium]
MTKKATRIVGLTFLVVGAFGLLGCKEVVFTHEIVGDAVDPTPFLGTWTVALPDGGDLGEPVDAVIRIEEGELQIEVSQGEVVTEKPAALTQIGATTLLSLDLGLGIWRHSKVAFEDGSNRLVVSGPDLQAVKSEILGGSLAGEIDPIDMASELVVVDAEASNLAARILANPTLFGSPSYVLTKQ